MDTGRYASFLFDFDGTLGDDGCLYDGVPELLRGLLDRRRRVVVVSNNSQRSGSQISAVIRQAIEVDIPAVTVCDIAHERILQDLGPSAVVAVSGSAQLRATIEASSLAAVGLDASGADAVLLGCSPEFCYGAMTRISALARGGAKLYCTNRDASRPVSQTVVPETGALVAAIEAMCDSPWTVLGKPEPALFLRALELLQARPAEAVMIGDGYTTDIEGATRLGIDCIWANPSEQAPHMDSALVGTISGGDWGTLLAKVTDSEPEGLEGPAFGDPRLR